MKLQPNQCLGCFIEIRGHHGFIHYPFGMAKKQWIVRTFSKKLIREQSLGCHLTASPLVEAYKLLIVSGLCGGSLVVVALTSSI